MSLLSVSGRKWILKDFDSDQVIYLKENFFLDEITSKLLAIKKIKNEDIKNYLEPAIKNILPNPNILKDMEKTVLRSIDAINNKEKIGIFGDYDVDGATSTAILGRYLSYINCEFEIYIPDRKEEGYGPSEAGFKKLIDKGCKLIFTLDCGTLSFEPIEFAKKLNVDTLVLDHHQSDAKLPAAFSIINPNRIDDSSNLNYLCAAGVCFMFLISLNKKLREISWFKNNNYSEPNLLEYLDLVSLGTVCDVVPLTGINRAIVKQGLKILSLKKNIGLKTLMDFCEINSDITTYHLGFKIGPRINAGGRVGKCSHGANLLLNITAKKAFQIASELENYNKERQILEKNLLNKIQENVDTNQSILIIDGKNFHEGVIGIVAARIKEKYNKPTIIISTNNKIGKASARSVLGFDIGSLILAGVQANILIKGGGHKMAGGFSIEIDKIDEFKNFANKRITRQKNNTLEEKKYFIDSIIAPSAVNLEFYNKVNYLAPFGSGNSEPKFSIENLKLINSKIVGEKHIKSNLIGEDGSVIKTIAFNAFDNNLAAYLIKKGHKTLNIVGKLSLNAWRGEKNVEFIIDDISVNKTH
jgi:single-stranded-DNA-specific exonuclease